MVTVLEKKETIQCGQDELFKNLMKPEKYSSYFSNTFLSITGAEKIPDHFEFVATVMKSNTPSYISGTINSVQADDDFQELDFEWNLKRIDADHTEINYQVSSVSNPVIPSSPIINPLYGVKTMAIIGSSTAGITAMAVIPTTMIVSSVAGTGGVLISKSILTAILLSVGVVAVGGGGVVVNDTYLSDPYIAYSLYPAQLPADLHGTELRINGFYLNDGGMASIYECDSKPIIYGTEYSFDCTTTTFLGTQETITTTVHIKPPQIFLNADAMDCISRHDTLSDDVTDQYPYLLNLPSFSPTKLTNLKAEHIKTMDDYFEVRDYESAKKHVMIILKYFNGNDIQTLSTLGNTIRDEDRQNMENIQCAMVIHSTPFIANTAWGTLSLAEDNHVLGNFETASALTSQIINRYELGDQSIDEITYKNALVIKANALIRMAMEVQTKDVDKIENIRKHYTLAHNIEESYDTWFGLGNLDRYVGDFDDALEKYEEAKKWARDSTEINHEIGVLLSFAEFQN